MNAAIIEVPPTTFVVFRQEATLPQIPEIAAQVIEPLCGTVEGAGLKIIGPAHFFYYDCNGDPQQVFRFEIGVPIQPVLLTSVLGSIEELAAPYEVVLAPAYRCFTTDYRGSMRGIGEAWRELADAARAAGLQSSGRDREVYRHWIRFDSQDNVTELQMGIL